MFGLKKRELEKEHKRRNKEDSTRYLKTRSSNSDFFFVTLLLDLQKISRIA